MSTIDTDRDGGWERLAGKVSQSVDQAEAVLLEHRPIIVCYPGTQGTQYATCSCGWAAPNFGRRSSARRTGHEAARADWNRHARTNEATR